MKITVLTGNQPRHLALIESLADLADEVFAVQECTSVFAGQGPDGRARSPVMRDYFARVSAAEEKVFGPPRFSRRTNVRRLAVTMGDLSRAPIDVLQPALDSDHYVVFGASWIRGELCEALVERRAVNVHLGVCPFYRGSACNFWALYDRRPDYLGATIHRLAAGLDAGPILFHAFLAPAPMDGFEAGMRAVKAAHEGLLQSLSSGELDRLKPVAQDDSRLLRYSKNAEFTDEIAREYLSRVAAPADIERAFRSRDASLFVRPFTAQACPSHRPDAPDA